MAKNIVILGSTGSIGRNALDLIERHPNRFKVVGLAAGENIDIIKEQIIKFKPLFVAINNESLAAILKKEISGSGVTILSGLEGVLKIATMDEADFVLSAIVGSAGLRPTMSAIQAGKDIGLANKEALVMAGNIVIQEAKRHGVKIIPVDSEHSAIYQSLAGSKSNKDISKLILTASGGPFRKYRVDELEYVTVKDALNHPNWNMGDKITIDSATMMNKGFEVIEAKWLFDVEPDSIEVLIHPQSIIHSMVEFVDTSVIAQMGLPDMRVPISYALAGEERLDSSLTSLNLKEVGSLTFEEPDFEKFPCLKYAYEAIKRGGSYPAVLNAANEVAVDAFLKGHISFTSIPQSIRTTMDQHDGFEINYISDAISADSWGRKTAKEILLKYHEYEMDTK